MYAPRCNGEYARTLNLVDRYFYCENCRGCTWSKELPDWDNDADYKDIVEKINQTYPYKVKVWFGDGKAPAVIQYSTIKDMVENACGIGYVSGLNDTSSAIEFIEGDIVYSNADREQV